MPLRVGKCRPGASTERDTVRRRHYVCRNLTSGGAPRKFYNPGSVAAFAISAMSNLEKGRARTGRLYSQSVWRRGSSTFLLPSLDYGHLVVSNYSTRCTFPVRGSHRTHSGLASNMIPRHVAHITYRSSFPLSGSVLLIRYVSVYLVPESVSYFICDTTHRELHGYSSIFQHTHSLFA